MECGNMGLFDRGVQMLLTTVGAFAAFSLMTIAVGTDYWLYSRGVCKTKSMSENETSKKNEEVMTHSGLWRTCCLEGKREDSLLLWCSTNFPNMVSFVGVKAACAFLSGRSTQFYCWMPLAESGCSSVPLFCFPT